MGVETNGRKPTTCKDDEQLICALYPDLGVRELAEKFEYSEKVIREVLYRNGIDLLKDRKDTLTANALVAAIRADDIQEYTFVTYRGNRKYVIMPYDEFTSLTKE